MVQETVTMEGHLIDSDILRKAFARIVEGGGDFEIQEFRVGKTNDDPSLVLVGGSGIVGPDGGWVAEPVTGREAIVAAEIDLDRIAQEQQALDAAGHYHRPDVFRVAVDETPQDPVAWVRDDPV